MTEAEMVRIAWVAMLTAIPSFLIGGIIGARLKRP